MRCGRITPQEITKDKFTKRSKKKTGYPDQDLSPGVAGCCEKVTDLGVGGTSILNF